MVAGMVSDKQGAFEFTKIYNGEYFVALSQIGFVEKRTLFFIIDSTHKHLNFGKIGLNQTDVSLDEVIISGEKSLINAQIDRKVYNVDQDLMSKAASATELLQKVPSVEVDMDGNISLRGSSNVMIMINGRTSPLMNKNSATVLQQLPASSIERIEVITNPSAKYKPDGSSGIINIVMKKNTEKGINGSVTGNAGNQDRYNGNGRINYYSEGLNIYSSYGIRKESRNRLNIDTRRQIDGSNMLSFYNEQLNSLARPLSHIVTLGADFHINNENEIGISGNYLYNSFTRVEHTDKLFHDSLHTLISQYRRARIDYEFQKEYGITAFFEHSFDSEDHTLRFEFTAERSPEQEDNHYTDIFEMPILPTSYDNTLIKNSENKKEAIIEYSNQPNKESKLEAGYTGEFINNDFDFFGNYFNSVQQKLLTDTTKTNRFLYDEAIHSIYTTFKTTFGDFGIMTGLRAEFVSTQFDLVTLHTTSTRSYSNIYPTIHTSYKLEPLVELQLSYSKRTHRPDGEDLNPFPEYRDPRNVSAGNPNLKPEYAHLLEFGFQYQNEIITLLPALFYRYTYNRFTTVTLPINDTTLLTTRQNLSNDRAEGVEIVLSAIVNKFFTINGSANLYQNQIDASNLGYSKDKSTTTWSGRLTIDLNLNKATRWQINTSYNSSRLTPQGEQKASYVVNSGIRQEFIDGKLSLVLTVADIFKSLQREYALNIPSLNQNVVNTRDARIIFFGFTYRFGTEAEKSKDEQIHYDDSI